MIRMQMLPSSMVYSPTMKHIIKALILTLILLAGSAVADTQQEIDHLLDFVAKTNCQYDRNGTVHSGLDARDHINMKYEHYRKKVKTAEDFIKYSATKSMMSGKKYKIRCPGAEAVNASDWLLEELHRYRKASG